MNTIRVTGLILTAAGAMLLLFGLISSESIGQVFEALTGHFTDESMWFLIGGVAAILYGIALYLCGRQRSIS